jgi:hypothetical protein
MNIIDHTPFVSEKGEIRPLDQLKATMKYGLTWTAEIKAQQAVISRLDKALERGFTLIRNQVLEQAGVTLPLVLVGPPGIFLIHATELRGVYRAKGDTWGSVDGTRFTPARVNLLKRTAGLARALQVHLERQGLSNFGTVEPVIMAADPGLHVESVRPLVRVVLNDAIERFAASLMQARPIMTLEMAHEIVERIQHPLTPKPKTPSPAASELPPPPAFVPEEPEVPAYQPMGVEAPPSEPAGQGAAFDTSELGFAFAEQPAGHLPPPPPLPSVAPSTRSRRKRGLFTPLQLVILGGMSLLTLCVFGLLAYFIFFSG